MLLQWQTAHSKWKTAVELRIGRNIHYQYQFILNIYSTDDLVSGVMNQRWCLMATTLKGGIMDFNAVVTEPPHTAKKNDDKIHRTYWLKDISHHFGWCAIIFSSAYLSFYNVFLVLLLSSPSTTSQTVLTITRLCCQPASLILRFILRNLTSFHINIMNMKDNQ